MLFFIPFLFQMPDRFFQAVHPLWYPACDGGLLQLAILAFWRSIMPYDSLGFYGRFTKSLSYNHHTLLVVVFSVAIFLHVFEAWLARRLCQKLKMDPSTSRKWFVQTLLIGYVSLGKLRQHAATEKRPS